MESSVQFSRVYSIVFSTRHMRQDRHCSSLNNPDEPPTWTSVYSIAYCKVNSKVCITGFSTVYSTGLFHNKDWYIFILDNVLARQLDCQLVLLEDLIVVVPQQYRKFAMFS